MLCMKSILPVTKTVTFKRKSQCCGNIGNKPIDWKDPSLLKEDNDKGTMKGYRVPCRGDSGSGQVVSISIDQNPLETFKFVLASVYSNTIQDNSNVGDKKNIVWMPCGSTALSFDSTTGKEVTLQSRGRAESTSWPEILDWIKNKAQIQ
jgi:hypothetical protein